MRRLAVVGWFLRLILVFSEFIFLVAFSDDFFLHNFHKYDLDRETARKVRENPWPKSCMGKGSRALIENGF